MTADPELTVSELKRPVDPAGTAAGRCPGKKLAKFDRVEIYWLCRSFTSKEDIDAG